MCRLLRRPLRPSFPLPLSIPLSLVVDPTNVIRVLEALFSLTSFSSLDLREHPVGRPLLAAMRHNSRLPEFSSIRIRLCKLAEATKSAAARDLRDYAGRGRVFAHLFLGFHELSAAIHVSCVISYLRLSDNFSFP